MIPVDAQSAVEGLLYAVDGEGNSYFAGNLLDDATGHVDIGGPVRCPIMTPQASSAFVVKIDSSGARAWQRCVARWTDMPYGAGITAIAAAPSGDVVVAGVAVTEVRFGDVDVVPPDANGDTFLMRLDASGQTRFVTTWTPAPSTVALAANDVGDTVASFVPDLGSVDFGVPVEGSGATLLARFDASGSAQWAREYDMDASHSPIALSPSGDVAITDGAGVARIAATGAVLWGTRWSSPSAGPWSGSATWPALAFDSASAVLLAGGTTFPSNFGGDRVESPFGFAYLLGVGADGAFDWSQTVDDTSWGDDGDIGYLGFPLPTAGGIATSTDGRTLAAIGFPNGFRFEGQRPPCHGCGALVEVSADHASTTIETVTTTKREVEDPRVALLGVAFGPHERVVLGSFDGTDLEIGGAAAPIEPGVARYFLAGLPDE
ncbi:MAG TPA: hypothetical protein VGM56_10255 [Byssovorax sp.]